MPQRAVRILTAIVVATLAGCAASSAPPGQSANATFSIRVEPDSTDDRWVAIRVTAGDAAVWSRFAAADLGQAVKLNVAGTESNPDASGVLGSVEVDGRDLLFHPRFPLLPGTSYLATFTPAAVGASGSPITRRHEVSSRPAEPPRVVALYPTSDRLPANHLKFYLHFSEPMEQGIIWDQFRVIDEMTGEDVPSPFRHTELWSEDGRRLTLWFHPGRQKTGVNLNVEIGPILEEGRRYTLAVSKTWRSQAGQPFEKDVRKPIVAVAPDHSQPDVASWTLIAPSAGSRDPFTVEFPEPLDWALLQSQLWIEDASGTRVGGTIATANEERAWHFTPHGGWWAGTYRLAIGTVLEDLAGNSVERPFEVDLTADRPASVPRVVYRSFEVVDPPQRQRGRKRKEPRPVIGAGVRVLPSGVLAR